MNRPRRDWVPWLVCLLGVIVFLYKVQIVEPIRFVGHADAAGYAEMADSVLAGRGFEVDYISWYFRKYEPTIVHPEDHWPPFYALLIVPFFATVGKTALAAKLPSLLISSVAFPLMLYLLGRRVTQSRTVAFASAVTILLYFPIFQWSLDALSDVTYGFLVTAAIYATLRGMDDNRWFCIMGALLAAAYYTKGSTLILIPAFVLYHVIWRLLDGGRLTWSRSDRPFAAGVLVMCLLILPWLVRNVVHFGAPLYSTQNNVAGFMGWLPWEHGTYPLYWGENLPSITDKLRQPSQLIRRSLEFAKRPSWWLFFDMDKRPHDFSVKSVSTYAFGIPALAGTLAFLMAASCAARRIATGRGVAICPQLTPYFRREYLLLFLVAATHLAFLCIVWEPLSRLTTPVIPLVIVIGWATLATAAAGLTRWTGYSSRLNTAVLLVILCVWLVDAGTELLGARAHNRYPWRESDEDLIAAGNWIRENATGSITMTRNPWELHFYSDEKAIQIPLEPLPTIIQVARYYGATHLIPDDNRQSLAPWIAGEVAGLEKVFQSGRVELYEIHYERLPTAGH
jgi:4-amino-4-deoxy-L-arabinose transferase-like glycosyltransferase